MLTRDRSLAEPPSAGVAHEIVAAGEETSRADAARCCPCCVRRGPSTPVRRVVENRAWTRRSSPAGAARSARVARRLGIEEIIRNSHDSATARFRGRGRRPRLAALESGARADRRLAARRRRPQPRSRCTSTDDPGGARCHSASRAARSAASDREHARQTQRREDRLLHAVPEGDQGTAVVAVASGRVIRRSSRVRRDSRRRRRDEETVDGRSRRRIGRQAADEVVVLPNNKK